MNDFGNFQNLVYGNIDISNSSDHNIWMMTELYHIHVLMRHHHTEAQTRPIVLLHIDLSHSELFFMMMRGQVGEE